MLKYTMYYRGLASTPDCIGIVCNTTNEIICQIETARDTGKETRRVFEKYCNVLKQKYSAIL